MKEPIDGAHIWPIRDDYLAVYAQHNASSHGRKHAEKVDPDRLPFQRDRDRIIHTASFRRLRGKMQVVAPQKNDHFRNRLSHTIEVSIIARDLARDLRLNEDLAETIALVHDIGHPPFGHFGEKVLDQKMKPFGHSFDHNLHGLRIVEYIESRYPNFTGLNLTWEVRYGMQKHRRNFTHPDGRQTRWTTLESQLVDHCDEIAYMAADLEDALRGEFIHWSDLADVPILKNIPDREQIIATQDRNHLNRELIHLLITWLRQQSVLNLDEITTLDQVQASSIMLIDYNADQKRQIQSLKLFLNERFWQKAFSNQDEQKYSQILDDLFDYYLAHQSQIPASFQEPDHALRVGDYLAGMTDQYAVEKWNRLKTHGSVCE